MATVRTENPSSVMGLGKPNGQLRGPPKPAGLQPVSAVKQQTMASVVSQTGSSIPQNSDGIR